MKNRFAKAVCKYPLNIQFFAEGDGAGAGDGNGGGSGSGSDGSGTGDGGSGSSGQSFDDFLKNGNQAEFDRRVNKAVETAVGKAREKWELLTNDKLSEAEKTLQNDKRGKSAVSGTEARKGTCRPGSKHYQTGADGRSKKIPLPRKSCHSVWQKF